MVEKIRVLLVGPVPPSLGGSSFGGVATHVAALAKHLAALGGVSVHLLAEGVSCKPRDMWCRVQVSDGYTVYYLGAPEVKNVLRRRFNRLREYGLKTVWQVGKALPQARSVLKRYPAQERNLSSTIPAALLSCYLFQRVQPHLIHVHDAVSHPLRWRLAAGKKTPIIATLHGISPVLEDHPERNFEAVLRVNLGILDACITPSSFTYQEAVRLGLPPKRVVLVPYGIDCKEFAPLPQVEARQRLGLPDGPLVLYCGQLIPRKNVAMLLEACSLLFPTFSDLRLAIVGSWPDEACLKSKTIELGMSDRILFAGARPHEELEWWYNACDIAVSASTSEGLAITMLEAMACGRPVIAAQSPYGSYDPLIHEETGLVFKLGDTTDLAAKIERLLLDPGYSIRLGQQARHLMVQEYDWPVVATRMIEFYERVAMCPKA